MQKPSATNGKDSADSAAERERQAIEEVLRLSREADLAAGPIPRFSLRELLLVTTLLAVTLALVRAFGLWGGTFAFVGCLVWTNVVYPRWHPANLPRQTLMFDLVWALLMPLVALVCDPFLFKDQLDALDHVYAIGRISSWQLNFRTEGLRAYCLIGWQMILLVIWLIARRWLAKFAGIFVGSWLVGAVIAGILALVLLPYGLIALYPGVGLLAFTPLFTIQVIARRLREAIDDGLSDVNEISVTMFWILSALGFITSWVIPFQFGVLLKDWFGT